MRLRRLFDLVVRHEFDDGGASPDLAIEASTWRPDGRRALERHRLHIRPRTDGIEVLAEVDGEGRPKIPLGASLGLAFGLRASGDFILYSEVEAWSAAAAPTYRSTSPAGGTLALGDGEARPPPGIAATIELTGILDTWLAAPPRFFLDIAARRARWAYYLMTGRPGASAPKIEDRRPDGTVTFASAELSDDLAEADDPIGSRLRARRGGRRCFRLLSATALPCRREPLRRLALLLGDELLQPELPNPSLHSRSRLKVEADDEPQQTLFRVLEY